jgi:hypothetical protein
MTNGAEVSLWLQEAGQWAWDNFEWAFYIIGLVIVIRIIGSILD